MKLEWVKQRVFTCKVRDIWGMTPKRVICRWRDDGVLYALTITVGHPYFDTRENIVREFAKFASEPLKVRPCTETEFDETFLQNLRHYDGEEVTTGSFYTYLTPDLEAARKWDNDRCCRTPIQRLDETLDAFPQNSQPGLP